MTADELQAQHLPTAPYGPASTTRQQLNQQLADEGMQPVALDRIGQPAAWAAFSEPVRLQASTDGSAL